MRGIIPFACLKFGACLVVNFALCILLFLFYILTNWTKWPSGGQGNVKALEGMRSGVRPLPPTFAIFLEFPLQIQCPTRQGDHHGPSSPTNLMSRKPDLMAIMWWSIIRLGQHAAGNLEVNVDQLLFGPRSYYPHPSNLLSTGPFYFSFPLYFFNLFILLFLFHILTNWTKWPSGGQGSVKALEGMRSGVRPLRPTFAFFWNFLYWFHIPQSMRTTMWPQGTTNQMSIGQI